MTNPIIEQVPYLGDFYAKLSAVTDAKSGAAITDAVVTVDLLTLGGTLISGAQGIAATYDPATAAYWAIIPRTASVQLGQKYQCRATASKGGLQVPFYQEVQVVRFPS